jgi:prevent-host-death family protein
MSVAEAKAHFAEAVKKAEAGERVLITRYGRPSSRSFPSRSWSNCSV